MARKTAPREPDHSQDQAPQPPAGGRGLSPPQRSPVHRDMSCSVQIGVLPSQVDCASCDRICAALPHSWRATCLATCRSACATGRRVASFGSRVVSALA